MPELPEVETTRQGIAPAIEGHRIKEIIIRHPRLRWPIPPEITTVFKGQLLKTIDRRAKYLLLKTKVGTLILHLGMSGRIHILPSDTPPKKHDHVDIIFDHDLCLRFTDPRRFGCLLWTADDPEKHSLLAHLGPEPLSAEFNARYWYKIMQQYQQPIKQLLMNSERVVGVGNIYANEALFLAGIHPKRNPQTLTEIEAKNLVAAVKKVLKQAIRAGGTTFRDFRQSDGKPGYFQQKLLVYGKANQPCVSCGQLLIDSRLGGRSTVFCSYCQPFIS